MPPLLNRSGDADHRTRTFRSGGAGFGLVPAAARTGSGDRQYSPRDVSVLRFIRQSRRLGYSIEQIADLLGLWSDPRRASQVHRIVTG